MSTHLTFTAIALLLPVCCISSPRPCAAQLRLTPVNARLQQPTPASAGLHTYHIEMNIRSCGMCVDRKRPFQAGNFVILRNGVSYPVQLSRPVSSGKVPRSELPTHVLMVIPPGAKRASNATLLKRFRKVFRQGWLVSINRPDGTFTAYSAQKALATALAAQPSGHFDPTQQKASIEAAMLHLAGMPGYRVLIIDASSAAGKDALQWMRLPSSPLISVHVIDGGHRLKVYYSREWGYSPDTPAPEGDAFIYRKRNFHKDGAWHEVKLKSAIKNVLVEARYDYDLSFAVPVLRPRTPGGAGFTLKVVGVPDLAPTTLTLEPYRVKRQEFGGETVAIRSVLRQSLGLDADWLHTSASASPLP